MKRRRYTAYMDPRALIRDRLADLPAQIAILEEAYAAMPEGAQRERQKADLPVYARRMEEGFSFLLTLDEEVWSIIGAIRAARPALLRANAKRYRAALAGERKRRGILVPEEAVRVMGEYLRTLPLTHSCRDTDAVRAAGIHPASELWMTPRKSSANPMDIALGMDRYCFCTQGFGLPEYGEERVAVDPSALETPGAVVTTVDIFTLVLEATGRTMPAAIPTEDWVGSLEDYARQLLPAADFPDLKADYVLTFFGGDLDAYHAFAQERFYGDSTECAPEGERALLGEVKILGAIATDLLRAV